MGELIKLDLPPFLVLRRVGGVSSAIAGVKAKLAEKDLANVVLKLISA